MNKPANKIVDGIIIVLLFCIIFAFGAYAAFETEKYGAGQWRSVPFMYVFFGLLPSLFFFIKLRYRKIIALRQAGKLSSEETFSLSIYIEKNRLLVSIVCLLILLLAGYISYSILKQATIL